MTPLSSFTPRFLTAPEYIFALHRPGDYVALLVRNRARQQTTQRILTAESAATARFQSWLREENNGGADIFVGMNPIGPEARRRTKENVKEIRHAYLDLDEDAGASLQAIRTSGDVPSPNFVLDTSPGKHQVVWRVDGDSPRERSAIDEVRDFKMADVEFPDGESYTAQATRRNDGGDAAAIGQPGIENGLGFRDVVAQPSCDILHRQRSRDKEG